MHPTLRALVITCCVCPLLGQAAHAQSFDRDIDFLNYVGEQRAPISQAAFTYMSRSVHSNSVARIDASRQALVKQMEAAQTAIGRVQADNDQEDLKAAFLEYISFKIRIYKNDWVRGMALKAISESSYNALRDYYAFLKEVDAKEDQTNAAFDSAYTNFAKVSNIQLIEDDSKFNKTMREMGLVNDYSRAINLSIFRANYLNGLFIKDLSARNKDQIDSTLARMAHGTAESFQELLKMTEYPGGDKGYRAAALAYVRYLNAIANKEYVAQVRIMKVDQLKKAEADEFNKNIAYFNATGPKLVQAMNQTGEDFLESKVPRRAPKKK